MSDTNRVRLAYAEEVTFGTAISGQFQIIRYTGESLRIDTGTTQSAEIREDRQIPDVVRNSFVGAGDINFEMPYGSHDALLEAALLSSDWTTFDNDLAGANTISVDGANVYTIDAATWSTTPAVGDWVEIRSFSNAGNNGYKKVTAATTTTITVAGAATTIEATVAATIDHLAFIKNGTELRYFTFEKKFGDLTNIYQLLTGFVINGLTLNIATGAILTASMSFLGKGQASAAADQGSGYTAVGSTSVMNAIDHVDSLLEGGSAFSITSMSFSLTNNLRAREQVGTLGPISIGTGAVNITGTVQAYFNNNTHVDKYLAGTESDLSVILEDAAGNGYIIDIARIKYTGATTVAEGQNGDVIVDMAFTAYRNSTTNQTIRITRFAA